MRAFFLITIFFIFSSTDFQLSFCADDQRFIECSRPFSCGSFTNLSYPFWGDGRPNYCGHQGFELSCIENNPVIKINNLDFRILNISKSNDLKTMTISRLDLSDNPCSPIFENTTLNLDLFTYSATARNLTLLYGYEELLRQVVGSTLPSNFSCNRERVYYVDDSFMATWPPLLLSNKTCRGLVISVFRTALVELKSGIGQVSEALREGFGVEYSDNGRLCGDCEESGGQCGFDNKTNQFLCFCRHKQQDFSCLLKTEKRDWASKTGIAVGAGVLAILLTCITICCFNYSKSEISSKKFLKKMTHSDRNLEAFIRDYAHMNAKRYRFSDVKKMTNSFKERLGQGGYGEVYRGKLLDGSLVAVKVLNSSKGNGQDFINVVASISRTSHVNVVTLLGFCLEGNKRALIYEYMPNGSLDKFIYSESPLLVSPRLKWEKLLQIATDIARGLEYLHRGCNTRILHFDIKPHNILLDEDLCPKISDFGLAKLCQKKESVRCKRDNRVHSSRGLE